jgi:plastocyanin
MTRLTRPRTLALAMTAVFALGSCSQAGSPVVAPTIVATGTADTATTAPTTSPTSSSASTRVIRRIDITVTGKQVTPTPAVVNIAVGESLTIAVTSDHNDQLHAHGFNIEKDIKAGQPLVITVKGGQTGVYEIELHHPALRILQVAVR